MEILRRWLDTPVALHCVHARSTLVPEPRHVEHSLICSKLPKRVRWARRTLPLPLQVGHVPVALPGSPRVPLHREQISRRITSVSRLVPKMASRKDTLQRHLDIPASSVASSGRAPEERFEDVAEAAEIVEAFESSTGLTVHTLMTETIVTGATLWIDEDLIGLVDLLETLSGTPLRGSGRGGTARLFAGMLF